MSLIAPDVLIGGAALATAAVLLVRGLRSPGPLGPVFVPLAAVAAACGLALLTPAVPDEPLGWVAAVAAAAAAVALARRVPAAEAELRARAVDLERLRLLETAVNGSGDGVMVVEADPPGGPGLRVAFANPAFERLTGYTAEEVVGLSPSVFCLPDGGATPGVFDPEAEAEAAAREAIRAALHGTEPVRMELPGRRKDGSRVWAEWQVVPVPDGVGRCRRWVAILRDTTERRRLEEQLRQAQKMEAVGRLAGGIAHDFNNLLTVIRGNAELLRPGAAGGPDAELVDDVCRAADRAAGLVRQLLTFSRRQPARPEVLDLSAVVADLAGMLRRLLGEQVTVVTATPVPVRTRIDRGQLEQVVVNLAVNARDAMPDGGTLTLTADAVTGPGGARSARLVVSDTGVGMTDEVRARLFEPFFTTKGPGKGTGLGLATVYGIVQQAGGRVAVESGPGAGSTFRVDLPWTDAPAVSSGVTPAPAARRGEAGRGRSVLLAEDEEAVRKLARRALEEHGYTVTEAENAEEALARLAPGRPPDLLVTDLTMPGMGGRELAGRVRAVCPEVGVVFISGYSRDADRLAGVPGAVFLPKPFSPVDLLRAARHALARVAVGVA